MRRLDVSSEAELEIFAATLRYESERPLMARYAAGWYI
jgi:hypothetical protein